MSSNDYMLRQLGYSPESPVPPPAGRLAQVEGSGSTGSGGNYGSGATGSGTAISDESGGGNRWSYGGPPAPTSVEQSTDQPGGAPPSKSAVEAEILNNPNLSGIEKEERLREVYPERADNELSARTPPVADRFAPQQDIIDLDSEEEQVAAGNALPRSVYVPAQDAKSSWTIHKAKGMDQGLLEADSDAAIDQKLALQQQGEIEARRAGLMTDAADRALTMTEKQLSQDQIKWGRIKRDLETRQARIQDERDEVDQLKVDPDRIFAGEGGTWAKILAGISILAGGLLMGLQGRQTNPGIDAVNGAIERDIRAQKEKIEARRRGLGGKETELERLMQIYGNPEIAERELRNRQLALVSAYAKRATMNSPDDVRANVDAQLADFDAKRVREQMQLDQLLRDDVVEQWKHMAGQTVGVGVPKENDMQGYAAALQKDGIPQAEADLGESEDILKEIPKSGEIPTEESRNLASRAARSVLDFAGGQGTGSKAFDSQYEQTIRGKFTRAKAKARHAMAGASLTDSERTDFEKQYEGVNTIEGLRTLNDSVRKAIERRKAAIGAGFKPEVPQTYEQRRQRMAPRSGPKSMRSDQ